MASNLSSIGFAFRDRSQFASTMTRLAGDTNDRIVTSCGEYAIWRSRAAAEIWFHIAAKATDDQTEREILGLTPFFEGQSEIRVQITEVFQERDDSSFEGGFKCWVKPDGNGGGSYPMAFRAIDFAAHSARTWPAIRQVRLTGFARDVKAYTSAEVFYAAQSGEPAFSAQSFVPIGLFAALDTEANENPPPADGAMLTGRVVYHRTLTNEVTGLEFVWLVVESLDAAFDIVADPSVVTGDLKPDGTVEVLCSFYGRIMD